MSRHVHNVVNDFRRLAEKNKLNISTEDLEIIAIQAKEGEKKVIRKVEQELLAAIESVRDVKELDVHEKINILSEAVWTAKSRMYRHKKKEVDATEELEELRKGKEIENTIWRRKGILNNISSIRDSSGGFRQGYYIIAADPNVGKSALLNTMSAGFLMHPEWCNIIYITLDDTVKETLRRILASLIVNLNKKADITGNNIHINHVGNKQYTKDRENTRLVAIDMLKYCMDKDIITVHGAKTCRTRWDIDAVINRNLKKDRYNIVIIDGVRKIKVKAHGLEKDNIRADYLADLADDYDIPLITTGELRKNKEGVVGQADIKGSADYGYNAKYALAMEKNINESVDGDSYTVSCSVIKNKLTTAKPAFTLYPFPSSAYLTE